MNDYGKIIIIQPRNNGVDISIIDDSVECNESCFIPNKDNLNQVFDDIIDKYPFPIC
jgi:hypothetical protein